MHFFETLENFGNIDYTTLPIIVLLLIGLALIFDFLNGLHDAANSIATVVSTRVLTPQAAVIWAAFFNFVAFLLFSLSVAGTIGRGIIDPKVITNSVIAGTLIGACTWNILTWYWGLPTSSSHALIGGLVGAGLAHSGPASLVWSGIIKTCVFIVLAPLIGLVTGLAFAVAVYWIFAQARPRAVDSIFRRGQLISAAMYSLGHGGNDAQKTMGIIFALLLAAALSMPEFRWHNRFALNGESFAKLRHDPKYPGDPNRLPPDVYKKVEKFADVIYLNSGGLKATLVEKTTLTPEEVDRYLPHIVKAANNQFSLTRESLELLRPDPKRPDDANTVPPAIHKKLLLLLEPTYPNETSFVNALREKQLLTQNEMGLYLTRIVKAADHAHVPTEIVLACHLAMGLGTLMGGWRIVKTMGQRIIRLRPVDGFCAESGAAFTLVLTIFFGIPVSTTHTITGAIVGVGSLQRLSAVRWGVAERVVLAWIFTIPGAAIVSALSVVLVEWIAGLMG